ncbi:MAG TPA: tail fiber domain-containing protein, partial [Pyrinomonadaceae bacterium]
SDNVEVRAGGGSHARTIYNSWGMRAWSVGALNNGNFQIADESAASFRFQITTGGESFINCHLAPWINGQFNLGYSQSAWQYVYAYAFPTISDASEKTDIAPHPVALPYVEALEPKTFRWKDMSNKRLNHGFIAQDVREVFGEDFGGWLGGAKQAIAYSDLTAVLWQGVRELSATVKRLSAELEMLKAGK